MDIIEANSKKYEDISQKHKRNYLQILESIPIVTQFIMDNNLIIYGGTAIDYALRLKGDYIYPDESLAIPDLDFYSPNNVKHAYDLADKLYHLGYESVRAIQALYVTTMRIDLIDNNFVADITYVSKNIFNRLPTLEYNGMKIIHPDFQKIDLHRSLSFPFDNTPWEVIFARWKKDIIRYNKLSDKYPINVDDYNKKITKKDKLIKSPIEYKTLDLRHIKNIFAGLSAYAIIYKDLKDLEGAIILKYGPIALDFSNVIPEEITISKEGIKIPTMGGIVEFVSNDTRGIKGEKERKYHAYMSILPKYVIYNEKDYSIKTYDTKYKLISYNKSKVGDNIICHVNIQVLLFMFLSNAHIHNDMRNIYLSYYNSLINMISIAEKLFTKLSEHIDSEELKKLSMKCPLFLSIDTYGGENRNESYEILRRNILTDIGKDEPFYLPINYYPKRSKDSNKSRPLDFVYERSKFFLKDGLEADDSIYVSEDKQN